MSMTACVNAPGLFVARFFLGIPEAGVVTCGVMFFTFWVREPHLPDQTLANYG